jgi:hypothetical protein
MELSQQTDLFSLLVTSILLLISSVAGRDYTNWPWQ